MPMAIFPAAFFFSVSLEQRVALKQHYFFINMRKQCVNVIAYRVPRQLWNPHLAVQLPKLCDYITLHLLLVSKTSQFPCNCRTRSNANFCCFIRLIRLVQWLRNCKVFLHYFLLFYTRRCLSGVAFRTPTLIRRLK